MGLRAGVSDAEDGFLIDHLLDGEVIVYELWTAPTVVGIGEIDRAILAGRIVAGLAVVEIYAAKFGICYGVNELVVAGRGKWVNVGSGYQPRWDSGKWATCSCHDARYWRGTGRCRRRETSVLRPLWNCCSRIVGGIASLAGMQGIQEERRQSVGGRGCGKSARNAVLAAVTCSLGRPIAAARSTRVGELNAEGTTEDRALRVGVRESYTRLEVLVIGLDWGGAMADVWSVSRWCVGVGEASILQNSGDANDGIDNL